MGLIVEGSCPCGYHSGSLFLGSGMNRAARTLRVPASCADCRAVVALDVNAATRQCPDCGGGALKAYGRLRSHRGGLRRLAQVPPDVIAFGRWSLPDRDYPCPRCGERSLRFLMAGAWD